MAAFDRLDVKPGLPPMEAKLAEALPAGEEAGIDHRRRTRRGGDVGREGRILQARDDLGQGRGLGGAGEHGGRSRSANQLPARINQGNPSVGLNVYANRP